MVRLALLLLLLVPTQALASGRALSAEHLLAGLDPAAAEAIGQRIFRNEAAGRREWLVHWLDGEDHLSLGIGHFIWYPAGRSGPFRESFQDYLAFVERRGTPMPAWLSAGSPAPWPDRASFLDAAGSVRLEELRTWLATTMPEQTAFMIKRLAEALPAMLEAAPEDRRAAVQARILSLLLGPDGRFHPEGAYVLIDYVNFKGDGTDPAERYSGLGWGLLQVLDEMAPDRAEPRAAFAAAAERVLTRRVALAPAARQEERWLDGWLIRIRTYRSFEVPGPLPADQAARDS